MRIYAAILLFALYFPIFFHVIPIINELPLNPVFYSIMLLLFVAAGSVLATKKFNVLGEGFQPPIFFGVVTSVPFLLRTLIGGYFREGIGFSIGILLGLSLLVFINQIDPKLEKRDVVIERFLTGLGLLLAVQVTISMYDSIVGIQALQDIYTASYSRFSHRDITTIFGLSIGESLGIKTSLTGLVGQHNNFGSMLVFMNFLLAVQYSRTRKWKYLMMLVLVWGATWANSTRISMFAIAMTSFITLVGSRRSRSARVIGYFLLSVVVTSIVAQYLSELINYVQETETMNFRLDLWMYLNVKLLQSSPLEILFGISPATLFTTLGSEFIGRRLGSFENQYITTWLYYGLPGLVLYIYVFHLRLKHFDKWNGVSSSNFGRLLAFNIIVTSMTLDCALHFASFFLIIVGYYICLPVPIPTMLKRALADSQNSPNASQS